MFNLSPTGVFDVQEVCFGRHEFFLCLRHKDLS
jgi:hypothetical protein